MIRILFDAAPLSSDLHLINDYGALMLFAPIAAPLLGYREDGQLTPSAWCVRHDRLNDGRVNAFELHPAARYACGRPLSGEDYGAALRKVAVSRTQVGFILRRLVRHHAVRSGISTKEALTFRHDGRYLEVRAAGEDTLIPHLLALPNLSPLGDGPSYGHSAGPYAITGMTQERIDLHPNPYFAGAAERPKLQFERCVDPEENYRRYRRGQAHVTCNTAFPYLRVECHRNDPDFHLGPVQLVMTLAFMHQGRLFRDRTMRKAVLHLIDRDEIARLLSGIPSPTTDLRLHSANRSGVRDPLFDVEAGLRFLHATRKSLNEPLTLSYDDYYPNELVAKAIRHQLAEHGQALRLVLDDFHAPNFAPADMKLMILSHLAYDDRVLYMLLPAISPLAGDSDSLDHYDRLIDRSIAAMGASDREEALAALDRAVIDQALVVPLLKLNEAYLARPDHRVFRNNPVPNYT